ncbi:PKD-like domain-containing protein [Neolewinella agarilytica]|uniref:Por secretion system C-terminal sorting domain-containing protein n=1 Tax=Neolewinella agarilytica TaxID=478744 RepID=A0A1H9FMN6_9BACT|nr:PKD-like domain-containing protein [Neolewinella agarilytica]SEQ39207.1 Por secretion system C-terminal sorting domain-containing protein [Neolewinella agarilytica]
MKNFTLLGRLPLLVVCFFSLMATSLQAQCDNLTQTNVEVMVNSTCGEQVPTIFVAFDAPNPNLNGPAIIKYEILFNSGFTINGNFEAQVELINGDASFAANGHPIFYGFFGLNSRVRILRLDVAGGCSKSWEANVANAPISNFFDLRDTPSGLTMPPPNESIVNPPCAGQRGGSIEFNVEPTSGPRPFDRFTVRQLPFDPTITTRLIPMGPDPNNVTTYQLSTNSQLEAGVNYRFLVYDRITDCEVSYEYTLSGSSNFGVTASTAANAACFGGTGAVNITPSAGTSNGTLGYQLTGSNTGMTRTGVIIVNNGGYPTITVSALPADFYTVELFSTTTGCSAASFANVTEPDEITATIDMVPDVCADATAFTVDISGVNGLPDLTFSSNFNEYSFEDTAVPSISSCWGPYTSYPLDLDAVSNNDGTYSLEGFLPSTGFCRPANQDTTVTINLILINGSTGCTETFPFDLVINAQPIAPTVLAYSVSGTDSLTSSFCSGDEVELWVTDYDADLDYTISRTAALPANVSGMGAFADSTFSYNGSPVTGMFENGTNSAVSITYDVVATSADGCPVSSSVTLDIEPRPYFTAFAAGTATDTVCSGQSYQSPNVRLNGSNGAAGGNPDMRWNYEWTLPAELTYSGPLALSAEGLQNNATTGNFAFTNTSDVQQVATLTLTPVLPRTVTMLSGNTTVADTCFGEAYIISVTVDPIPAISVSANNVDAVASGSANTPVITICSGSTVDFMTEITAAGSRVFVERQQAGPNNTIFNVGNIPLQQITRNFLPTAGLSETLINTGNVADTVTYRFNGYTYGPDGTEAGGDDCFGQGREIKVRVLPDLSDPADLQLNLFLGGAFVSLPNDVNTVCSNTSVWIDPGTALDPSTDFGFVMVRSNDANTSTTTTSREFNYSFGGTNFGPRIFDLLINTSLTPVTYTYSVQLFTPGPDGVFDGGATGSDDCPGPVKTITITVEPEPVLTADAVLGTPMPLTSGDEVFMELCSQDDFSISNLNFSTTGVSGRLMEVEATVTGGSAAEFLNIPDGTQVVDINGYQIGASNVLNTSGSPYFAEIILTPRYTNSSIGGGFCEGAPIKINVVLNPEVTTVTAAQTFTSCNKTPFDFDIMGGTNQFESAVIGSQNFAVGTQDFVFPVGAARIENVVFTLSGADGGAATNGNLPGGRGAIVSGAFPVGTVLAGDTIRVQSGNAGADFAAYGNGGDGSVLYLIAGPNRGASQGNIVATVIAGGGGGAGNIDPGVSVLPAFSTSGASNGVTGTGAGGSNGGKTTPSLAGGIGFNVGGGGGGGHNGGDGGNSGGPAGTLGGSSAPGTAGLPGTSFVDGAGLPGSVPNPSIKNGMDANGAGSIAYRIVYDDVRFTLTSVDPDPGLTAGPDNDAIGTTDTATILNGESWTNPTDGPLNVVYVFSTSTEASCPGGQVTVTATIEPTPLAELVSNTVTPGGTMVTKVSDTQYTATVCSGDSLSAYLFSSVTPSQGDAAQYYLVDAVTNGVDIIVTTGDTGNASGSDLSTVSQVTSAADSVLFYETALENFAPTAGTVTYTITPYIEHPNGDCAGEPVTLTVTVDPGFDPGPLTTSPSAIDVCSGQTFGDAGFDLMGTQPNSIDANTDSIMVMGYTVALDNAVNPADFDTLVTPAMGRLGVNALNEINFRNRTGKQADIEVLVRLVSPSGCLSDVITFKFTSRGEPIIDIVESATNQIDTTICSGQKTGLVVRGADNSAFRDQFDQSNDGSNRIEFYYELMPLPDGVTKQNMTGSSYPGIYPDSARMANDTFINKTDAALEVVYRVAPIATLYGCVGDTVNYTIIVQPEPIVNLELVVGVDRDTFGLDNSRMFLDPNPADTVCSNQALTVNIVRASASSAGSMLMANVTITEKNLVNPANLVDNWFTSGASFTVPVATLADTLSFMADSLVNLSGMVDTFTVSYFTFFNNPGVANCGASGTVEFDIVVLPVNEAVVEVRPNDGSIPPISPNTVLCSGELFDLAVKAFGNNPTPLIDSFVVKIDVPAGLVAGDTTFVTDTTLLKDDYSNSSAQFTRILGMSFVNTTPGIKTVTYIATPYTEDCAGIPDTTTVSFEPEIVLTLNNLSVICAEAGVTVELELEDVNGRDLNDVPGQYRWEMIGGTAKKFALQATPNSQSILINDAETNTFIANNRQFIYVTPQSDLEEGYVDFAIEYDNTGGCIMEFDTVRLTLSGEVEPGVLDTDFGVQCDGATIILSNALLGESAGGVFTFANGDPLMNGQNFTPSIGGTSSTPVGVDFKYVVGGGDSGCDKDSVMFTIMVEPEPNSGTWNNIPGEACQGAGDFDLFSMIPGATDFGIFNQEAGPGFAVISNEGTITPSDIATGLYTFSYTAMSQHGCMDDDAVQFQVLVNSASDCSTPIPCDEVSLTAGFNVISFDVIPEDASIESVFADLIATNNLQSVIAIYPDEQTSSQSWTFFPGLGGINFIPSGVRGGYGLAVEVVTDATVSVCGVLVDTTMEVQLQSGLNIVGYPKQEPTSLSNYFSTLISDGNLVDVRTIKNGQFQQSLITNLGPFGPIRELENGFGYLINLRASYAANSWRSGETMPTSNFDRLYGQISDVDEYAGETLYFTDEAGNVMGTGEVREDGYFLNVFLYGDLAETPRISEGFQPGEEVFVRLRNQIYTTGITFKGDWSLRKIELILSETTSVIETSENSDFTLAVFPNPSEGQITVKMTVAEAQHENVTVQVINALGQEVSRFRQPELLTGQNMLPLDLVNLPAGNYYLRVVGSSGVLGTEGFILK